MRPVIPDPSEPTVGQAMACPRCEGTTVGSMTWQGGNSWHYNPCPDCCCASCGQLTDTPPQCRDCAERQADEDAAKAYREGREW